MTKNRVATALAALAALAAATAAPAALTAPTAAPRLSPVKSKQQFRARPTHSRPRQLADPVLVTTSRVCHKKIAAKPPGFTGSVWRHTQQPGCAGVLCGAFRWEMLATLETATTTVDAATAGDVQQISAA